MSNTIGPKQLLSELYQTMEASFESLPLATQPSDLIPGEGDPQTKVMLVGEAPGHHEHVQRRPFVGRSGQLLRQTLEKAALPPETVYISNIVKVRPPDNRDPLPQEIAAFRPYLDREIEIISPRVIITLGRFSMAKFLPEVKISQVHGRLHRVRWQDRLQYILPMYHPAAALRGNQMRQSFEADFAKVPKILAWIEQQQELDELAQDVETALF